MPRSLSKSKVEDFEPKKKNPLGLLNDSNLDSDLKTLLVGGEPSGLELSKTRTRINTDLEVDQIIGNIRATGGVYMNDGQKLVFNNNSDLYLGGSTYFSSTTTGATNYLDLYVGGQQLIRFQQGVLAVEVATIYDTDLVLSEGKKLHFAGIGGNSHIEVDDSAGSDYMFFYVDNTEVIKLKDDGDIFLKNDYSIVASTDNALDFQDSGASVFKIETASISIPADSKVFLDGSGGHTYLQESADDTLDIYVGGDNAVKIIEGASQINLLASWKLYFDGGVNTYIEESADDVLDFVVGTDKMLILDEASDTITMGATNWIAGTVSGGTVTEFSADNSAYAGMILGYTRLEGDLTSQNLFEIQNAITVEDATHKVTFKTPPSEYVEIEAQVVINNASTDTTITCGLSDNATYSSIGAQYEYDYIGISFSDDEADDSLHIVKWVLPAAELVAIGSDNEFWIGFGTAGSAKTAWITYGVRASHGIATAPFIIKATALPATIYDGQ